MKGLKSLKRLALCLLLVLLSFCLLGFDEEGKKIYDDADLLDSEQEQRLQQLAVQYARETKCDLIIVSINDNQGKSAMEYAEDFYVTHNFGYDVACKDGVLLLIDMDGREVWISSSGKAISLLSDIKISYILDECAPLLTAGNYYDACRKFLSETRNFIKNPSSTVDKNYRPSDGITYVPDESRTLGRFLLKRLPVCLALALAAVWLLRRKAKAVMTVNGHTYAKNQQCNVRHRQDLYIRTTVTKTPVPKSSGSNGGSRGHSSRHTGGGGRSFGGGGRKF